MVINAFPAQWKTRIKTPFLSYFSVWSNAKRSDLLYFCDEYMHGYALHFIVHLSTL